MNTDRQQIMKLGAGNRPLFRHKKTGGVYIKLYEGLYEKDLSEVVIYRSVNDSKIWVRNKKEFFDGRFELV